MPLDTGASWSARASDGMRNRFPGFLTAMRRSMMSHAHQEPGSIHRSVDLFAQIAGRGSLVGRFVMAQ